MATNAKPSRDTMNVEVSAQAQAAFSVAVERWRMPKKALVAAVLRWFAEAPEEMQAVILAVPMGSDKTRTAYFDACEAWLRERLNVGAVRVTTPMEPAAAPSPAGTPPAPELRRPQANPRSERRESHGSSV